VRRRLRALSCEKSSNIADPQETAISQAGISKPRENAALLFVVVVVWHLQHGFISLIVTLKIFNIFKIKTLYGGEVLKALNKKIFRGAILESILLNIINDASDAVYMATLSLRWCTKSSAYAQVPQLFTRDSNNWRNRDSSLQAGSSL
jgi:hypothetical protein